MVTNNPNPPPQGSVEDLLVGLLDKGYNSTAGRTVEAVTFSYNDPNGLIQRRLAELDAEAARLAAEGKALDAGNPVVRAVLADVEAVTRRNAGRIDGVAGDVAQQGIDVSANLTRQLTFGGTTNAQLNAVGITWRQPDPEAINALVGYVDNPAFAEALTGYSDDVVRTVSNQIIRGVVDGWSPLRIAREVRRITETYPSAAANTLLRTLQLESYRTGTAAHQNANRDVIRRVIRVEILDDRTCLCCWSLHGTVVWDGERDAGMPIPRISEHYNGRGTTITEVIGRRRSVRTGVDIWNGLPASRRRGIAGDAAFNAMEAGAVRLEDFAGETTDPLFGDMVEERSLRGILGSDADQYYARNQR